MLPFAVRGIFWLTRQVFEYQTWWDFRSTPQAGVRELTRPISSTETENQPGILVRRSFLFAWRPPQDDVARERPCADSLRRRYLVDPNGDPRFHTMLCRVSRET